MVVNCGPPLHCAMVGGIFVTGGGGWGAGALPHFHFRHGGRRGDGRWKITEPHVTVQSTFCFTLLLVCVLERKVGDRQLDGSPFDGFGYKFADVVGAWCLGWGLRRDRV